MTDIIEDIIAFLYATDGNKDRPSGNDDSNCPVCGAEMEEGDDGEMRCPDCNQ